MHKIFAIYKKNIINGYNRKVFYLCLHSKKSRILRDFSIKSRHHHRHWN